MVFLWILLPFAILAEIFMAFLKIKIFSTNKSFIKNVLLWNRYVDDMLCVGKWTQFRKLEIKWEINFLDLKL